VGEIIINMGEVLRRVLGEHIVLEVQPAVQLTLVSADAGMIERVIINLAVNARDAMPRGGRLTIAADEVEVTEELARQNPEGRAGRFVCLSVTDSGAGISPENRTHIFEPFFTTKISGQGAGLGLATVYGIVKQHAGWIDVQSTVGQGSTFRAYFPLSPKKREPVTTPAPPAPIVGGTETILVVEDEDAVRQLVASALRRHGYQVFAAASGADALEIFGNQPEGFDLLLTDMVMPGGMSGRALATRLHEEDPSLKVLFMTGYNPSLAEEEFGSMEDLHLILKPFSGSDLLRVVRHRLDPASASDASSS
jgi:two-component system cell cycle sensor histidine kinase/response regulator CckA